MSAPASDVTLVVCTCDRVESLLTTLDTVAAQATSVRWDVLVVDNVSRDGSLDAVRARAESFPVPLRVLREERRGRSFALNRALAEARADVLIFTDDDVNVLPGFVDAHARVYDDPGVAGAGGRILPILPRGAPNWLCALAARNGGLAGRYDWGDAPCEIPESSPIQLPYGANMSMRREVARAAGGFRTDLGWGETFVPGEESDLFGRMRRAGARIAYRPEAAVEHRLQSEKATLDYFLRYEAGYGRSQVLTARLSRTSRVRWILRNALHLAVHAARARRAGRQVADQIEPLRQCARARGRLAQLLGR